jgi:hypothetical protein
MNPTTTDPRTVKLSASLYSLLLTSYPTRFRQEYGPHMLQVFRDCCRKAYRTGGLPGMLWLWARTFFDYLQSVIEEHSQRGVHMNKVKFIRLCGWAFIVGAFAWVIGWAVNDIQYNNPYNAFTLSLGKYVGYLYGSVQFLLPSALFLTTLGFLGLYLRYSKLAGKLGRIGLVMGLSGGATALLTFGLEIFTQFEYAWYGFLIVFLLTFIGLTVFGIAASRNRLLPRWKLTPVLTGFCGILSISGLAPLILFTSVGLFILGYLLQSDPGIISQQPATG